MFRGDGKEVVESPLSDNHISLQSVMEVASKRSPEKLGFVFEDFTLYESYPANEVGSGSSRVTKN